ncbi:MAG: hypothetical protein JWP97_100 [Labilithrix sp.]|nr:hypothetical protein [Labilithrix sp.]
MVSGGVLFRVDGALHFLPATIATKVQPMPSVARVPGAPTILVGVALVDGEPIAVVTVADPDARGSRRPPPAAGARADNRPLLVCTYAGERVGLVGLEVVATGRFDEGALTVAGETARAFDVGGVLARLREHRWAV